MQKKVFGIALLLIACAVTSPNLLTSAQAPTPKPANERCIIPDQAVIDWISLGLLPEDGTYLRHVWAVKSDDFKNVWFVAADIEGPGMDSDDEIAIWATNALTEDGKPQPDGGGAVFSVEAFAREFSDWPTGDFSLLDDYDGMDEAKDCAKGKEQLEPTATP